MLTLLGKYSIQFLVKMNESILFIYLFIYLSKKQQQQQKQIEMKWNDERDIP